MVIYEFWKNQTQRSCTWVAGSDACLKYTVYGLFELYVVHGKGSTTALDFMNHNKVPFIDIYELWKNQTQRSCTGVSSYDAHLKMHCL